MFSKLSILNIVVVICSLILPCPSPCKEGGANNGCARISLDADKYDFGQVEEGVELKHTFKVSNTGSTVLQVFSAYSSCGCTVPKLAKKQLKPGENTDLLIIVDTTMKQNKITKTVYLSSNDPNKPVKEIRLSMNVKNPHSGMTLDMRAKIFTDDRCAACHVARGVGLFGAELYEADCAMCHGKKAQGVIGPALWGPYDNAAFKSNFLQVTSYGSKIHRSMPGFLVDAGGPLAKEQIESIMRYLAKLSKDKHFSR